MLTIGKIILILGSMYTNYVIFPQICFQIISQFCFFSLKELTFEIIIACNTYSGFGRGDCYFGELA